MLPRLVFLLACFPLLVLVHELGHFAIARLFKIPLSEFVVGFGVPLKVWQAQGITFRLHLLPFSAYVKPMSDRSYNPHLLKNPALWRQVLFFAGGAIANFLLAIALLFFTHGNLLAAISQTMHWAILFAQQILALLVGTKSPAESLRDLGALEQMAFLSLVFGCINLVPIMPFDGAQIIILLGRHLIQRRCCCSNPE